MNLKSLIDLKIKDIRFSKTMKISWSKYYGIHALVPVKDIIRYNNSRLLDATGKCFLNGTNFNYTFYKKENDSPIMSIDFRGKGNRFSEDGDYVKFKLVNEFMDKERLYKLKFKATKEFHYPYFIISLIGERNVDKKSTWK